MYFSHLLFTSRFLCQFMFPCIDVLQSVALDQQMQHYLTLVRMQFFRLSLHSRSPEWGTMHWGPQMLLYQLSKFNFTLHSFSIIHLVHGGRWKPNSETYPLTSIHVPWPVPPPKKNPDKCNFLKKYERQRRKTILIFCFIIVILSVVMIIYVIFCSVVLLYNLSGEITQY